MKITVELSDKETEEICRMAGEKKKGPAVRKLALESLALRRREVLLGRIVSGKANVELPDWMTLRRDRESSWT